MYQNTIDRWQLPAVIPLLANQAFLLATRNGGLALGRKHLGVISPGAKADIVVWDGRSPSLLGWADPVASVIFRASVADIRYDHVDGEFKKRDGKLIIEGYADVQDRFLTSASKTQALIKAMPLPSREGTFFGGPYPYGYVPELNVQRGEKTGYGPNLV